MSQIVGICGLICSDCPAYIATKKNNGDARKKTAEIWSKEFSSDIKPEDINCDGCLIKNGEGKLFSHCLICEIRKCAQSKNLKNCAYCKDFQCEKLLNFHKMVPEAESNLLKIRETLK